MRVMSGRGSAAGTRATAVTAGIRIEQITLVWMVLEAAASIYAGIAAHSVLLTAFGVDSVIELVTGAVLLWRLLSEARHDSLARVERAENMAAWVAGIALALLCLYIVGTSAAALVRQSEPDGSYLGIGIALIALAGMPVLAWRKRVIAARLDSAALRGDAACSITCAYMAAALLAGLGLNVLLGWWWADDVGALALLYWLQAEAREALQAARSGHGGCSCCE